MGSPEPTAALYSAPCEADVISREHLEAFEIIYQSHRTLVQNICRRMLRNPIEAEDVTQDVFMHVFRKIHTFRGESALSTWLYRVTTNLILRRLQQQKSRFASQVETWGENNSQQETGKEDPRLTGLFDRMSLETAIDRLPNGCKAAFVLHDVQGYRHREISSILGYSIANSKSQLHKARKRLRTSLTRHNFERIYRSR